MKTSRSKPDFCLFAFFTLVALLISMLPISSAQAKAPTSPLPAGGDFGWAKGVGGGDIDIGKDIIVDSSGNVYTTGTFHGTADFDPGVGVFNLTSTGIGDDIYILKLDNMGNFIWAKSLEGLDNDSSESITVDSNGNVYTTGYFQLTADFDPGVGVFNLNSAGREDIFVSKLDGNGNFVWAKKIGGINKDVALSIAVDINSNVYTTGYFAGTADFDPGPDTFNLTNSGFGLFISKLDSSGNFVWAKGIGGSNSSLTVDSNGSVYMTGYFAGTVDFDPGAGIFNLTSAGGDDIFVSKLDSSGNFIWAKSMGGASVAGDHGYSVSLDTYGNIYTTGIFNDTADFDPGIGVFNLTSTGGNQDIFISKLDNSGNFVWARSMGGPNDEYARHIATDSDNNVYTTGYFNGTADFDPGAGIFNLTSAGVDDIFVSRLDSNGNFVWAKSMGGASVDEGNSIALDLNKNVYTTGRFHGTADFDPGPGSANLTTVGGWDAFISKLKADAIFSDVLLTYWANNFIERLYASGITGGCSTYPLMYCPETSVTRAQMAVFLLRGEHGSAYNPPDATGTVFGDVPLGHWAGPWIEQLAAEGITGGCGNGNFCPDLPVTRDQMAIFLLRAEHGASYAPPTPTGVFTDVPTDHWAAAWIEQLAAEGITGGCSASPMMYCPATVVNRAQMAVFLVRAFNLP